jgi:PhoPQ-activated pathogenicity-related protein
LLLLGRSAAGGDGLVDYVRRPDPAFRWSQESPQDVKGSREVRAELVSQSWRGFEWKHRLRVVKPNELRHRDLAVLIVGGDSLREFVEPERLAAAAGVPVALLADVPNQPLFGQSEDALISFTFTQYLRSEDADWPLLLPMTKAAVRALDAVAAIAARDWQLEIRRFVVTGASKRGWTSWLTAVADARVAGIAPVVFDNLNFAAQLKNQHAVWGSYSPEIGDYTERGLAQVIDTERGRKLRAMVDPYEHLDALGRVAKLLVNGTNDPYWEVGAVGFYWPDVPGAKSILEIPNAGHGAGRDARVAPTLAAFVTRVAEGRAMPDLRWADEDPSVVPAVISNEEPSAVGFWQATAGSRDFRNARWRRFPARRVSDRFVVDAPAGGFIASFAEAEYTAPTGAFTLSTPVRIRSNAPARPIEPTARAPR